MPTTVKEALRACATQDVLVTLPAMPKAKLPKKLGPLVDQLHDLRDLRLAVSKLADAIKAEETRVTDHIIDNLDAGEGGAVGLHYKGLVVRENVPVVEDWEQFYEHIRKTKSFDLLNKAVNRAAVKARWDESKPVPGVDSFQNKKLSITKV